MRMPLARSARCTESAMAAVASWILSTLPLCIPADVETPTPRTRMCPSGVYSPTTVQTLVVPTSMAAKVPPLATVSSLVIPGSAAGLAQGGRAAEPQVDLLHFEALLRGLSEERLPQG